jgi:hypothetical protein
MEPKTRPPSRVPSTCAAMVPVSMTKWLGTGDPGKAAFDPVQIAKRHSNLHHSRQHIPIPPESPEFLKYAPFVEIVWGISPENCISV